MVECRIHLCNLITHGLWHCVIGVGKDSGVMGPARTRGMVHG